MTDDPSILARTVQVTEHWLDGLVDKTDLATRGEA